MGKASKWFRVIFGLGLGKKQNDPSCDTPQPGPNAARKQPKKKWSFVKSSHHHHHHHIGEKENYFDGNKLTETSQHGGAKLTASANEGFDDGGVDPSKHAIAVAAATAAVAEAAVAAAHAAAAVVKLTSSGRTATTTTGDGGGYGSREFWAAVKIQSHFRAYLSRRALRALKALVRLQALVRGHIVRKQTAEEIRRMQALLRVQARARAGRSLLFESPLSASKYIHAGPPTPEKFEHVIQGRTLKYDGSMMLKRNGSKSNGKVMNDLARAHGREQQGSSIRSGPMGDKRSDKILEIDTGKPHITPKCRNLFHSTHLSLVSEQYCHSFTTSKESTAHQSVHSPSSGEVQSSGPLKFIPDLEDGCYCTADSSPQFYSASSKGGSSKRGPFTPTKSDGSQSCLSGYSDHPSYMSFTESSKAKMRSLSAPKQRPHYERSSSTKRYLIHSFNEAGVNPQRVSALHANFANKAYPGSGRLDRLGMPVGGDVTGFSGGHWHRF